MTRRIIIHPIKTKNEKIPKLTAVGSYFFRTNQYLDIIAGSDEAAAKIDELLWKYPHASFLPHALGTDKGELIHIFSYDYAQEGRARICLNLTEAPLDLSLNYSTILEFEDRSNEEKKKAFREKYHFYKEAHLKITEEDIAPL